MMVEKREKYKKAIVLDKSKMNELHNIIHEFCDTIEYEVELKNGRIVNCDLKTLLEMDNFEKERIIFIKILAHNRHEIVYNNILVYLGHPKYERDSLSYSSTCEWSYTLDSFEKADIFEKELINLLEKSKASYWRIAKVNLCTLVFLLSSIISIINILNKEMRNEDLNFEFSFTGLLIAFILVIIVILIDKGIHNTIWRDICFIWGEETKVFERNQQIRHNIFWGIIIPLIIGLVASFLYQILMTNVLYN